MKKRFIVLINFSDHSKQLLSLAHHWKKKANAELLLVHQVVKPAPGIGESEMISAVKDLDRQTALNDLKSFAPNVIGKHERLQFHASTTHIISIIETLEAKDIIDYLFVGMNDKSMVDRLFFGSTVSELSKQLDKIIFAFPTITSNISIESLYVGVNEKYNINEEAFEHLIEIMSAVTSHLHFFSVVKPDENKANAEKNLQPLQAKYNNRISSSYKVLQSLDPGSAVKDYMINNKGLFVIQKGGRSIVDIFRRFLTTELIQMARIPIVILPSKATSQNS